MALCALLACAVSAAGLLYGTRWALLAPGAVFIASGIIDTRKEEVLAGLRAAGLEPFDVREKRGWVCIVCRKQEA